MSFPLNVAGGTCVSAPRTGIDERLLRGIRDDEVFVEVEIGEFDDRRPGRKREQIGEAVASGIADVEPLGSLALANPDIVERLKSGAEVNKPDGATFFGGGAAGYTDYPRLGERIAAE